MALSDALLIAGISAVFSAGGAWAVIRYELSAMRHQINAAHRRLDGIGAPPAGGDVLPG